MLFFASCDVGVGHTRVGLPPPKSLSCAPRFPSGFLGPPFPSEATGVGKNEHPVAAVRGANGTRGNAVPLRVVPALGQVPEYASEPQGKVPWDVLHEEVAGSYVAKDAEDFGPQVPLVAFTLPSAGERERLARIASREEVERSKLITSERLYVVVLRDGGPVLVKDALRERVDFDLADARVAGTL